ncbi:MAG: ABC transporter substrate-binding protein [Thermomicrobiales bacterium]|nr:ABC transporter substrate-binding protein [Thermomicrobiales bacterium]
MSQQDSLRSLLDDVQARSIDRRSFIQRGIALGLTPRAMAMVLGAAGVAVPVGLAAAAQTQGGSFTEVLTQDPQTLDPHLTSDGTAWNVFNEIFSPLMYQDIDFTYKGLLAESWETSEDSLTITFTLREGVTFHDGSEFNADSVKYTIDRLREVGTKSPIYDPVQTITVDVIDPKTVTFTFETPDATFFNAFADGYAGMMNQSSVEAAGDEFGRKPVGSAAFMFKEWNTGNSVTLSAFDNFTTTEAYFDNKGRPYLDELGWKIIAEPFAQIASLETGEIDAVDLSATDLPRFENDDRFEIFEARNTSLGYLGLTRTRPLMEDVNVRTAIAHAIDRQEIVDTIFTGGLAEPVSTPLPPSIPGYNAELEATTPAFDLDAAKKLLDDAGWVEGGDGIREKDGVMMQPQLYTTTSATYGQAATLIQAQLRKIGVDVVINQIEQAALQDFTPKGEHDMLMYSWGWSDPNVLYIFLSSTRMESSNRVHYSNPDLDALLVEGQQTLDWDARMEVYYKAQEIIIHDLPWVPLYMPITKTAVNKRIQGMKTFPTGRFLKNDAWVEE